MKRIGLVVVEALCVVECIAGTLAVPDVAHAWQSRRHEGIPAVAVSPKNGRLWATWFGGPTDCEGRPRVRHD